MSIVVDRNLNIVIRERRLNAKVEGAAKVSCDRHSLPLVSNSIYSVDNGDALTSPGLTVLGVMETTPKREASAH